MHKLQQLGPLTGVLGHRAEIWQNCTVRRARPKKDTPTPSHDGALKLYKAILVLKRVIDEGAVAEIRVMQADDGVDRNAELLDSHPKALSGSKGLSVY